MGAGGWCGVSDTIFSVNGQKVTTEPRLNFGILLKL